MKVTALETIVLADFPNLLWLHIHTDEGIVGLGETFYGPLSVSAYLHETVAPYLLGQDPLRIEGHAHALRPRHGFRSDGAELRGNSALDIALWDVFGQASGQPIYQLLGGKVREDIRLYNTCAGYQFIRSSLGATGTGHLDSSQTASSDLGSSGPYEDLQGFLERPAELARSLLNEGITAMKIWPFDEFAKAGGGQYISGPGLRRGLEPLRKIREAVGDQMDIMVELHRLWNLPTAVRIARALEEFDPFWLEDAIKPDNASSLAALARRTTVPICASEVLGSRWAYRELLESGGADIIMLDVAWLGGLSEAKKVAAMAESYNLPVTAHDCTGPVTLTASVHLGLCTPNALIQEYVRAFYTTWYAEMMSQLPPVDNGMITAPPGPGLGCRLKPEVMARPDATIRRSELN